MIILARCSLNSCDRPVKCRGMCKRHYEKWLAQADLGEKITPKADYDSEYIVAQYMAGWTLNEIADHYGRSRGSLRDYIRNRPDLYAQVQKIKQGKRLDPEQVRINNDAAKKSWKLRNPEKVREINRRWAANRSDEAKKKANARIRAERPKPVLKDPEAREEWIHVLWNDPCCYCGSREKTSIDHILAVADGGSDDWENLTAACLPCNQAKKRKPLLDFLLWRQNREEVVV